MGHTSANVRKSLVFCMVDMHFLLEASVFEKYLSRLNSNQQKLVNIYIERKQTSSNDWPSLI